MIELNCLGECLLTQFNNEQCIEIDEAMENSITPKVDRNVWSEYYTYGLYNMINSLVDALRVGIYV